MTRSDKPKRQPSRLPSEDEIIEFLATFGGKAGKRDIARAFDVRGAARIDLKLLLKTMAEKGTLAKRGRRIVRAGALPDVAALEITGIDSDGELVAVPVDWDESTSGPRPDVTLIASQRRRHVPGSEPPPARGDRILAKISWASSHYEGRMIRKLDYRKGRLLGVFRAVRGVGARVVPVDKKSRHEMSVNRSDEGGAQPGELVEVEVTRDQGRGLATARVRRRLGDLRDQRNISLIAIHEHAIPSEFSDRAIAEAHRLQPFEIKDRRDLRHVPLVTIDPPDARDHDDAVWAAADSDPSNIGGFQIIVAIADVAAYVRPGSALDHEARIRATPSTFPIGSSQCCRSGFRTICAPCVKEKIGPPSPAS